MEKSIRHVIGETGVAGVVAFCRRGVWCVIAGCFLAFFLFSPSPGFSQQGAPQEISTLASAQQDELLRLLREGDREEKRKALYDLLGMGKSAAPVLIEALKIPDTYVQMSVIKLMGEMGIKEAVPHLIPLIDAKDPYLQQIAILGLGHLGDKQATEHLVGKLEKGPKETRFGVIVALGFLGNKQVVPVLEKYLNDDDELIQCYTAGSLGLLRNKKGFELALKHSRSESPSVQEAAIQALGQIKDGRAIEPLKGLMQDPKFRGRSLAHIALREIEMNDKSNEEKIKVLAEDIEQEDLIGEWAAGKLREIAGPEAVEVLKANAKDKHGRPRRSVVNHLRLLGVDVDKTD